MKYLTELIEIESRLNSWEITDPTVAQYIMKDRDRKKNWLKEGEAIEEYVLNSNLSSDNKANLLSRINKSYSCTKDGSDNLLKRRIVDFGLGFISGIATLYFISNWVNKKEENFFENVMKKLDEKMNLNER